MSEYSTPPATNMHDTGFAPASVVNSEQAFGKQPSEAPEALRAHAEKTITQLRESYAQIRQSLDEATSAWESSFEQANKGASEFNSKIMEMAQRNVETGFDFARKLTGARSQTEAMELQAAFVREQFDVLKTQLEEIQQLSTRVATDASRPIQQQVSRSVNRYGTSA